MRSILHKNKNERFKTGKKGGINVSGDAPSDDAIDHYDQMRRGPPLSASAILPGARTPIDAVGGRQNTGVMSTSLPPSPPLGPLGATAAVHLRHARRRSLFLYPRHNRGWQDRGNSPE